MVTLTTRFLGLRHVFIRCERLRVAGVSKENVTNLWKGTKGSTPNHSEWNFFLELAASCISDEPKIANILESNKVGDIGCVPSSSGEYSIIERLLVASESW